MKIIATFANRAYSPRITELVCAWDEDSVEENREGWLADKEKALASWGSDLLRHVDVEILVPMQEVERYLEGSITVGAATAKVVE